MNHRDVQIVGGGPSGLTAALYLARAGFRPVVYEQAPDVGARFHGDFQGLENWSAEEDVLETVAGLGVRINFRCVPYGIGEVFGPSGWKVDIQTESPLFYLIERGGNADSLDQGLKRQAVAAGAEFRFGTRVTHAHAEKVIVATGPRQPDAVARGLLFETSHPDGFYAFLDDRFAPQGYAHLLVHDGRATLATCLFDEIHRARSCFEVALRMARERTGIDVRNARTFGGYVNFGLRPPWTRNDRFYYVGERAGFQNALFGFGLRYALRSGALAARTAGSTKRLPGHAPKCRGLPDAPRRSPLHRGRAHSPSAVSPDDRHARLRGAA